MPTQIKFGTSGWRAVMAEGFTFANVRRAVTGIARYVAAQKPRGARFIVGRDPRFLGGTLSTIGAEILARVARRGKSLGEQLKAVCNQVGSYCPNRENFRLTPEVKEKFTEKLRSDPREFAGHAVREVVRDGLKLVFDDGSWVCTGCRERSQWYGYTPRPATRPFWRSQARGKAMDFRVRVPRNFPRPEDGLRAVVERAPRAEALAASWIEWARPLGARVYALRRRVATVAVGLLACLLFIHVMFGANGMVVYNQKRAEYDLLRKKVLEVKQENERYKHEIESLKSDQKAIEKEAREQLGYAKPGEYVYVSPAPTKPVPPANHSAQK